MKNFLELTSEEVSEAAIQDNSVVLFSIGGIESHGPHLPIGNDYFEAEYLSKKLALEIEEKIPGYICYLMPCLPMASQMVTRNFSVSQRPYVLKDYLVDTALSLYVMGFKKFVCVSGTFTPKQLTQIEEVQQALNQRTGNGWFVSKLKKKKPPIFISFSSAKQKNSSLLQNLVWPDKVDHGGTRDTSIALVSHPQLVKSRFKDLPSVLSYQKNILQQAYQRLTRNEPLYIGHPKDATPEKGEALLRTEIQDHFPVLKRLLIEHKTSRFFRSKFYFMPHNRSFFKAWSISFVILIILMLWIYTSLEYFVSQAIQ